MKRFFTIIGIALFLFLEVAALGCIDTLKPVVISVNTSEKTLTEINVTLAEIQSHELRQAIEASKTIEEATAEKQRIMLRFHPIWKLYDRARASWAIAQIGAAAGIEAEKAGGQVDIASVTAAAFSLAKDFKALSQAMKDLVK